MLYVLKANKYFSQIFTFSRTFIASKHTHTNIKTIYYLRFMLWFSLHISFLLFISLFLHLILNLFPFPFQTTDWPFEPSNACDTFICSDRGQRHTFYFFFFASNDSHDQGCVWHYLICEKSYDKFNNKINQFNKKWQACNVLTF